MSRLDRRAFLLSALTTATAGAQQPEPIIDIHQHTNYSGRSDTALVAHQRKMGVTKTVLLPAGSKYGLAAGAGGNDSVVAVAKQYPKEYVFFANELPDIPETRTVIEKYLKAGAIGIGEQKFPVDCDSAYMNFVASIAQEFNVPLLMHFEHSTYNMGIERFHKMLERYPRVNFIGHAQTWWANISKDAVQTEMYPAGKVVAGGITDRLLADYPNMYGDLSANSGRNALARDPGHAREFLRRHQDKLLFGSDCSDSVGEGEKCIGARQLAQLRQWCPSHAILRKILHDNAARLLKL